MNPNPLHGCLYWVVIPGEPGEKRRPALVVSVDARNRLADDVLVIPASTTLRVAPTHVRLRTGTGGMSAVLLEEVERGVLRAIGVAID